MRKRLRKKKVVAALYKAWHSQSPKDGELFLKMNGPHWLQKMAMARKSGKFPGHKRFDWSPKIRERSPGPLKFYRLDIWTEIDPNNPNRLNSTATWTECEWSPGLIGGWVTGPDDLVTFEDLGL